MTSLGRVGRILAGSLDPSSTSVGRDSSSNFISKSSSTQYVQGLSQNATESEQEKVSNRMETLSTKTNESIESSASSQQIIPANTPSSMILQGKIITLLKYIAYLALL